MSKYKLNKKCKACDNLLLDKNKSGYCNIHRDRTGSNNSFYGKHHSKKTKEYLKKTSSKASIKNWKNEEYRKKVIDGVSKPRKESFKKEQSERIIKWYIDNPVQKEIRSESMKKSWENGNILSNNFSFNKSKVEKELFLKIVAIFKEALSKHVIKHGKRNWFMPDIFIPSNNLIIEYYGNFWHANPKYYKPKDIIHHNIMARDIWEKDKKRIDKLESMGYKVSVIWEDEYQEDPESIVRFLKAIDWEACAI